MTPARKTTSAKRATRPYNRRLRAEQAAGTRAQVIAAAHAMLDDREAPQLTLEEVARAAGVSRATVYNQFGSRAALLAAVFEDLGRVIRYERVQAAQALDDPREALNATIREACRCWASSRVAIRRILALGILDPEAGKLNSRYERHRRVEIGMLAQRLQAAGLLASDISLTDAAAILGALTSPQAFELLVGETTPKAAAERLLRMATTSLGLQPLGK